MTGDADDLFVARSLRYELPERASESEGRFEYDHSGGRPVLRSFVTTTRGSQRIVRLDVEECRFGPIPESEFGLEAFLAGLGPGRPDRTPEARPSTAMVLDRYWLAFVAGAISLVGGTGLAVGSRGRIGD